MPWSSPRFIIVGRNDTTTSHDTITVTPATRAGPRSSTAPSSSFTGLARFAGPLMKPLLDRLGDKTADQLETALDRL